MTPQFVAAARHIELLAGSADTDCHFRLVRNIGEGRNLSGRITDLWPEILAGQRDGWQVFVVVNEGGHTARSIVRVRALFVDADGLPTPIEWHAQPDFLVRRDATHWHAYWLVADMPLTGFKGAQRRLAAHYGTDRKVCDLPRIMRLAGSFHLKDAARPLLVTIEANKNARTPQTARTATELLAGLPDDIPTQRATATPAPTGEPISLEILREMLGYLDPGWDRDDWRDIIAAIRAAPVPDDPNEDMRRQLAHSWSEGEFADGQPDNYDGAEAVDRVFDDMVPGGGISVGTLIAKARAAGYEGPISIAEAQRLRQWTAYAAEQAEEQAEAAFWQRIIEGSGGAIQRIPDRPPHTPSPAAIERMKRIVTEERARGDELARKWGLR